MSVHVIECHTKCIFKSKVQGERKNKLRECNSKVLHGILPCNRNLFKWKIRENDECDLCHNTQTIQHLLFECSYVKPLWKMVNDVYAVNVTFSLILGTEKCFRYNKILTLVSFLIYKEWLVLSFDKKRRPDHIAFAYFKSEIKMRIDIYRKCNLYDEIDLQLLECLHDVL